MDRARQRRIQIIRQRLLRSGWPRVQVSVILLMAGLAGFLTSFALLQAGVWRMSMRYPIAILIAYCAFLLLLHLWLWLRQRGRLDIDLDPSALESIANDLGRDPPFQAGGGGDFGGGGAGGSWGDSTSASATVSADSATNSIGFDLDLEEGWLVVVALVALIGGLIASLYVVYIAPALLAEIIVDGILMVGLFKRLKKIDRSHWLRGAIRQTILPALLAALFFTLAGYAMQRAVPGSQSIGDVWNHFFQ